MKDLNRYVVKKHAKDWEDIGLELGLDNNLIEGIRTDNPQNSQVCLRKILDLWLKSNTDDVTWKTLELVLTNVNRINLRLSPVNDLYGKDAY